MIKYFAAVLLLASLAYSQGYVVVVLEELSNIPMAIPMGCINLNGDDMFILYKDNKIERYLGCAEQNEDTLVNTEICEAPKCEFVTELPGGYITYKLGYSCEQLEKTAMMLIKEKQCFATGDSISILFDVGNDKNHISGSAFENTVCTGEPFQTLDIELGTCQEINPIDGGGTEPMLIKIERSAGIQTIVSLAFMVSMIIAFV